MASLYSPAEDPLRYGLSKLAQGMKTSGRLETEVLIAEAALGLAGTSFTGDQAELAKGYVALQVNLQVRMSEDKNSDIISEGRGAQAKTFATVNGVRVVVDPVAAAGVAALITTAARAGSYRNRVVW